MAWHRATSGHAHRAGLQRLRVLGCAALLCALGPASAQELDVPPPTGPRADPAAEPAADPVADAVVEAALPVSRFEANLEFEKLVESERYEEADVIGRRVVELTIEEFGAESTETGDARVALAQALTRGGEYERAEELLLVAVETYRNLEGVYSERLIRPLLSLGENYHESGEHLNAVSAYNEARTVSRRVHGLLNENQIDILDRMTRSFMSMNEYLEAEKHQLEALQLVERNHPQESVEALEAIYKYARWLRDGRRYGEEREQYARATRIIRQHYGEESVHMVRPLQETGNSYRTQGAAVSQGATGLRQALEILQAQPEPDRRRLAEIWRDLGDWQVAFAKVGSNGELYRRAWDLLGELPEGDELREEWFQGIEYVFREPLSQRSLSGEPDAPEGFVLVKFDIDESGRTRNIQILDSDPRGLKDDAVARHVRLSRFRPHIRDGELTVGDNLALQVTFKYLANESPGLDRG